MNDAISRSAVIDRIAEFLGPKGLDEWEVMVEIRGIIENAPALDVAPVVHGHWIEETFTTYISAEYDEYGDIIPRQCITNKCSVCGRYEPEKEPYCNCGARMDGEADAR